MRQLNEAVAVLGDLIPVPVLAVILLLVTGVAAVLWYWWPAWLPRRRGRDGSGRNRSAGRRWRWPRFRWPRFRWFRRRKRRQRGTADQPVDLPPELLPDLPAGAPVLSADELAGQGRYKEAVRERLRALVTELIVREVVSYRPGLTVEELARQAGTARPPAAAPMTAATEVFTRLWYAQRPAEAADDVAMRGYVAGVTAVLDQRVPA